MEHGNTRRLVLRPNDLTWRSVGDEVVVLDLGASAYFTLNGSAATLWPALVEGTTVPDLELLLRTTYDIDEQTAAADVAAFVADLSKQGMLASDV